MTVIYPLPSRCGSRQQGVTLLELLVALFIFALAAGTLLKIVGEHARHAEQLESRYFAELAAHNHLATLQLLPAWPAIGQRKQRVELAGRHYLLLERVETTDTPLIRKVTVDASQEIEGVDAAAPLLAQLQAFMGPTP